MCYKQNKSLFFSSNVCHFQYDHRFLVSREMGNIRRCKEIHLQKLIKFGLLEE